MQMIRPERLLLIPFLTVLLLLSSAVLLAQQPEVEFQIPRITDAPIIDGSIGELEWAAAERVSLDIETNPGDNIPATVTSEALIMEDGEILYVAFISWDPDVNDIRAFYRDRDNVRNNDQVGIVLDTFNDQRRAYEFYVNPYGVQMDAINDDVNNRYDSSWNAIWDSAGRINEDNYTVEMAIPLKQLRFTEGIESQTWGINFVRRYPRDRDYRISNRARNLNLSCYLCDISKAQGFADLEPGRNLEVIPTLTTSYSENRDPLHDQWVEEDIDPQASIDVRWGINQNLYLNATLNPDFSQVEADRIQLDTNTTFSIFVPERRTFFLEMDRPLQSRLSGLFGGSETYFNGKYFDEQFNQVRINFRPTAESPTSSVPEAFFVLPCNTLTRIATLLFMSIRSKVAPRPLPPSCFAAIASTPRRAFLLATRTRAFRTTPMIP